MRHENLVRHWLDFADMDANLAEFTFAHMRPKPLELICYHCQQAAEKALKALVIASAGDDDVPRTHDLALLADNLSGHFTTDDALYNACSDLTPYGVKVRYPKEIEIDESLTEKALSDMRRIVGWVKERVVALR